jgi:hypothetical protein
MDAGEHVDARRALFWRRSMRSLLWK